MRVASVLQALRFYCVLNGFSVVRDRLIVGFRAATLSQELVIENKVQIEDCALSFTRLQWIRERKRRA